MSSKITFIEVCGKKYPLSFSLGASKKIAQRVGDLTKLDKAFSDVVDDKTIDNLTYMLAVLSSQGAAYMNVYENIFPVIEGTAYEDGKYLSLTQEDIEAVLSIEDLPLILEAIQNCMGIGSATEIEIETKGKNAKTPKAI